jgi:hypothetical protein
MSCVVDVSTIVVIDSAVYLSTRCFTVKDLTLHVNIHLVLKFNN